MDRRFCSIVVAVDPQDDGSRAEALGAALARRASLPIELVTEVPPGSGQPHRAACFALPCDAPGRGLVDDLRHRDGVLLVVAATTWESSGSSVLDPAVEHVLERLLAPVLVVGPKVGPTPSGSTTLVVAVDASGIAAAAMPVVAAWVGTFGGNTLVVEVIPPATIPTVDADARVRTHVTELNQYGIETTGHVLRAGEPAPALISDADRFPGAILVVTSPRWAGEPSHWHSTSRRLIRDSSRPVLVVPADFGELS